MICLCSFQIWNPAGVDFSNSVDVPISYHHLVLGLHLSKNVDHLLLGEVSTWDVSAAVYALQGSDQMHGLCMLLLHDTRKTRHESLDTLRRHIRGHFRGRLLLCICRGRALPLALLRRLRLRRFSPFLRLARLGEIRLHVHGRAGAPPRTLLGSLRLSRGFSPGRCRRALRLVGSVPVLVVAVVALRSPSGSASRRRRGFVHLLLLVRVDGVLHHAQGALRVHQLNLLALAQLGVRGGETDHRLEGARSHRQSLFVALLALPPHLRVLLGDVRHSLVGEGGGLEELAPVDVFFQEGRGEQVAFLARRRLSPVQQPVVLDPHRRLLGLLSALLALFG
mmetsp:Transcript_26743/g.50936  ORF Transcript_26743/g.50936 Transcript_26743/m.50936 type:complete len:336 (-) Transcript_26743:1669-2676(-)